MRTVRATVMWQTHHEIEIPDNHKEIETLEDWLDFEDVKPDHTIDLWDWDIKDTGPE